MTINNSGKRGFYETVQAAVNDIVENGFDSAGRIEFWMKEIRKAADAAMTPPHVLEQTLRDSMRTIYDRLINKGGILAKHPGVSRFTLERIKPHLRAELDRRIMASANLIKLNRTASIEKTLQRFSGWSTSIPAGGSKVQDKVEVKANIKKALNQLPFEERRVLIDQGSKFASALNETVAVDGGAIAVEWHSRWREPGYDYREPHKERDGHVYAIRGNWALAKGLMNKGDGYTDEMDTFGELPFCRCTGKYLYALRALPDSMLTAKGRGELKKVRVAS